MCHLFLNDGQNLMFFKTDLHHGYFILLTLDTSIYTYVVSIHDYIWIFISDSTDMLLVRKTCNSCDTAILHLIAKTCICRSMESADLLWWWFVFEYSVLFNLISIDRKVETILITKNTTTKRGRSVNVMIKKCSLYVYSPTGRYWTPSNVLDVDNYGHSVFF